MTYFPPPPKIPVRTGLFDRVPPAIFPPILGLFGLIAAWGRAVTAFHVPNGPIDLAFGAITLVFVFCTIAYLSKIVRRPAALAEDIRTLPGRTGLAALCLCFMVLAALLTPLGPGLGKFALTLGGFGLLALALFILPKRLRGTDTAGPVTPAMHLIFVGFILIPPASVPLGVMLPALPWIIAYCTLVALFLTAVTVAPLLTRDLAPPLRPLQGIQLAPPAFVATGAILLDHPSVALVAMLWGTVIAALLLIRVRWLTAGGFSGFWSAFTFPVTAYAGALILSYQTYGWTAAKLAGAVVLAGATLYIPVIAVKILKLWANGTLAAKTNASSV